MDAWFEANPGPHATVSDVADHIDHVREVAGIDHVGIGSDFDGTPTMPEGLEDVSRYPVLFEELASRGYGEEELMKIAGRNVLRVMREGERTSTRLRAERSPSKATIEELDGDNPPPRWLGGGLSPDLPTSIQRSSSGRPRPSGRG